MKRRSFALLLALVLALSCCPMCLAEETMSSTTTTCTHENTVTTSEWG